MEESTAVVSNTLKAAADGMQGFANSSSKFLIEKADIAETLKGVANSNRIQERSPVSLSGEVFANLLGKIRVGVGRTVAVLADIRFPTSPNVGFSLSGTTQKMSAAVDGMYSISRGGILTVRKLLPQKSGAIVSEVALPIVEEAVKPASDVVKHTSKSIYNIGHIGDIHNGASVGKMALVAVPVAVAAVAAKAFYDNIVNRTNTPKSFAAAEEARREAVDSNIAR